jgi:hypothetical protein
VERDARARGLGIHATCGGGDGGGGATRGGGVGGGEGRRGSDDDDDDDDAAVVVVPRTPGFVAEFEPLDHSTEVRYGDDPPPKDPGDSRGCSDFGTYEDALPYAPYYGDVARLDREGDGVPCPGLPHTVNGERYRMKRPNNKSGPKIRLVLNQQYYENSHSLLNRERSQFYTDRGIGYKYLQSLLEGQHNASHHSLARVSRI